MTLRLLRRAAGITIALAAVTLAVTMLLPAVLGYERYAILTGSMAGTYDPGSVVYAKTVPVESLRVGDVITYAPPPGASRSPLVTHRIVAIARDRDGRRVFRTKGDANQSADPWTFTLTTDRQARAAFSLPYVGRVVMALTDRETRMLLVGGPAILIALLVAAGMVREARGGRTVPPSAIRPWVRL